MCKTSLLSFDDVKLVKCIHALQALPGAHCKYILFTQFSHLHDLVCRYL